MKGKKAKAPLVSGLRGQTEPALRKRKTRTARPRADKEAQSLACELQAQRSELEATKEELSRARSETEVALEKYSALFDFVPVGYFVLDARGLIHEATLAGAALLGLEQSRVAKKRFGQFIAPDHRARFRDFCSRVLQTGEKLSCQVMIENKKQIVYVSIEGLAIAGGRATRRRFHATVIDLTEQRRAETLAKLMRASQAILSQAGLEGLLQKVVDAARELTGARRGVTLHGYQDGFFASGVTAGTPPWVQPPSAMRSAFKKGGIYRRLIAKPGILRVRDKDLQRQLAWFGLPPDHGYLRGLLGASLTGLDGRVSGLILLSDKSDGDEFTAEDEASLAQLAAVASLGLRHIEARAHAEEGQRILQALMDNVPEGVTIADAEGTIRMISKYGQALSDRPKEDLEGTPIEQQSKKWTVYRPDGRTLLGAREYPLSRATLNGEIIENEEIVMLGPGRRPLSLLCNAAPIRDAESRITGGVIAWRDITERKQAEESARKSALRLELISDTATQLLQSKDPQSIVNRLCQKVMEHLDCHAFFNYLADDEMGCLHLNAYAGIPEEAARTIEWLDYGAAVCVCAARDGCRIVAENIPETPDPRTDLVRSFGIKAYACHPLLSQGRVIGTLSFGTRSRLSFSPEDLSVMKTVADQVAFSIERMRAEEELRESRDALEQRVAERTAVLARTIDELRATAQYARNLIEASLDPLVTISQDGRITDVNKATEHVTGVSGARLIGSDFSDYFTEPEKARAGYQRALSEGLVRDYPLTIRHASGRTTDVLYNAAVYRNEAGEIQGVFAAARDITERKLAERRAQFTSDLLKLFTTSDSRREYLESAVELIRGWSGCFCVGIRVVGEHGPPPFESHLGFSRPCWEREDWLSATEECAICVRVVNGELAEEDGSAVTPGESFRCDNMGEFIERTPSDRRQRYLGSCVRQGLRSLAVLPIRYRGRTLALIHLGDERPGMVPRFDIDFMESVSPLMGEAIHRFNVEEQLRENYQSLQESEQRLKALNETLGQRAEQLRRLAAEVTRAEQRERRRLAALLHDNLQQLLVATKFSIRSLRRLTSDEEICRVAGEAGDILDQAIAESKSLTMELSPPILHQGGLAPALRWLGSWMHQKHGLTVNVQVDDDAIGEGGDVAVSLFSAARELLLNVVKHAGVHRARVRLARQDDQHVQLVVADKGAGFDPAQTIEGKIASGGFGLFNIRERLALLGGRLEVESTPGRGSRFTLVVPVRRPTARVERPAAAGLQAQLMAQPAADAQAELIGALGRKIRILLADDHTVVRQGLARLLQEEADMEVVGEAADGYTAVELARSSHPDVVVMDVTMSGLSGIEATRVITGELPHVRVIGLSMHEEEDMALEMRRAGAAAYVTKAGATDTLVAAIRAATAVLHGPETP